MLSSSSPCASKSYNASASPFDGGGTGRELRTGDEAAGEGGVIDGIRRGGGGSKVEEELDVAASGGGTNRGDVTDAAIDGAAGGERSSSILAIISSKLSLEEMTKCNSTESGKVR